MRIRRVAPWLLLLLGGCAARALPNDDDVAFPVPVGAALGGLTLGDGWQSPHALPAPVNSPGCQDSSFISGDGATLYFAYTEKHFGISANDMQVYDGAMRPGEFGMEWNVFEARVVGNGWSVVDSSSNVDGASQGGEGVDDSGQHMVVVRLHGVDDIYLSTKVNGVWGTPVLLDAPISTRCYEDNPALSPDGQRLYFDSNRVDAAATSCKPSQEGPARDLYVSTLVDGKWSFPALVAGAPNQGDLHWQGYARDADFFWTGHDAACGGALCCLYRARLQSDGSYGDRVLLAQPTDYSAIQAGDVFAVGEASITADHHLLYFTYGMTTTSGADFNFQIGVAWHP